MVDARDDRVLWYADSLTGELELDVEGSTVTARGQFRPSDELTGPTVGGEFRATC